MEITKYIRLEWPESQEYLGREGCFNSDESSVFVPENKL